MRVLVLADIDSIRWQGGSGEVDLLLALGDISDCVILEAAEAYGAPPVFAVRGNHDVATNFPEGISDLHMRTVEFGGLTFGGFGGAWRYKPRGNFLFEQDEVATLLKDFPRVDIFIAHSSPTIHAKDDGIHTGFTAFDQYIREKQPRLFLHGHQHIDRETIFGATKVIGVYKHRVLEFSG